MACFCLYRDYPPEQLPFELAGSQVMIETGDELLSWRVTNVLVVVVIIVISTKQREIARAILWYMKKFPFVVERYLVSHANGHLRCK